MLIDVCLGDSVTNQAHPAKVRRYGDGKVVGPQARAAALGIAWWTDMLKILKIKVYATTPNILHSDKASPRIGIIFRPAPGATGY